MKVLLIEDCQEVVKGLCFCLQLRWPEVAVVSVADGQKGIEAVENEALDLVFVDLSLPHPNASELVAQIRSFSDIPIILLAGDESELDRATCLESGADDCIRKPFSPIDLLARVRAVLRRAQGADLRKELRPFVSGDLEVNFATREIFLSGQRVRLTPIEYRILTLLARNQERVIPHRMLLERVWGPKYQDDVAFLKKYIYRLRQKLGDDSHNPRLLLSERGVGYKFVHLPPSP